MQRSETWLQNNQRDRWSVHTLEIGKDQNKKRTSVMTQLLEDMPKEDESDFPEPGSKIKIALISLHGLVRANAPELGRDADTGGSNQIRA